MSFWVVRFGVRTVNSTRRLPSSSVWYILCILAARRLVPYLPKKRSLYPIQVKQRAGYYTPLLTLQCTSETSTRRPSNKSTSVGASISISDAILDCDRSWCQRQPEHRHHFFSLSYRRFHYLDDHKEDCAFLLIFCCYIFYHSRHGLLG